jgi:hypothetical protein
MEKFSVIIPTIWKSEFTTPLLQRLSKCEAVGEIILIDNAPDWDIEMNKLIHIKESENTYVNPAWNKGVELAKYNNITIANDDILFNVDEYFHYMEQIPLKEFGFVGSHSDNYKDGDFSTIHLEKYDNQTNVGGWGCLFSFDKRNWKPIPNQLKIWYGDNWIHATNGSILQLRGIQIETLMSTSSDLEEVREIRDNDTIEWMKLINQK